MGNGNGKAIGNAQYAAARGLRSLLQIGFVKSVIDLIQAFNIAQFSEGQVAAILTLASPLVAVLQNYLEARGTMPGLATGRPPAGG